MNELTKADVKVAQVGNNSNLFTHLCVKAAPVFRHTAIEKPSKLIFILTASVFFDTLNVQHPNPKYKDLRLCFRILIHYRDDLSLTYFNRKIDWAYLLS